MSIGAPTNRTRCASWSLACAGLFIEATAADFRAVPGGTVDVTATAINRSPAKFTLREIRFPDSAIPMNRTVRSPRLR